MSAVQALSSAAVPAAATAGAGSSATGTSATASFGEALRAETPAAAAPANKANTTSAVAVVDADTNAKPEAVADGVATQKPAALPAAPAALRAAPKTTQALAADGETLPAALPGLFAPGQGETAPLRESTPAADAASPVLAAPEAFLQWLDTLKDFSKPAAAVNTALSPAASEPLAAAVAGLQGASGAAVTQQMIEALAQGSGAETAAVSSTPTVVSTAITALSAPQPLAGSSPASPATAPMPLAMDQGDWPQQLGEQIQWRLGVGIQEARIEISPRELGAIDVRLSVDDRGLSVQLSAAQAQTREMLQAELPRLREALQQGGLQLADAQVGREAPGRQGERHAAQSQGAGPSQGNEEGETAIAPAGVWRARRGLLDDYA